MNKDSEDAQTPIKTLDEYINRVFDIRGQWYNCVLAFRGQRDCNWDLESSAQRRLKASLSREQEISDGLFINYHEDLINRCKLSNFDRRDGERLNDLEASGRPPAQSGSYLPERLYVQCTRSTVVWLRRFSGTYPRNEW